MQKIYEKYKKYILKMFNAVTLLKMIINLYCSTSTNFFLY